MKDVVFEEGINHRDMGISQDCIGWKRFVEVIILKEIVKLQKDSINLGGCSILLDKWAQGLIVRLLEVKHGQWLYKNMYVHDATVGMEATVRKEELQPFIEDQLEPGEDELDERDHYLLEISFGDLETSTVEGQHYWLLQIKAARCNLVLRR